MIPYLLGRLLQSLVTLLVIATITFALARLLPGGPYDPDKPPPKEVREQINRYYHLNEPVGIQYLRMLRNLARLDLGPSYRYLDQRVQTVIARHFPVSAALGVMALMIALAVGVPLGVYAARHQNGAGDWATMGLAIFGVSVPNFVLGTILLYIFVHELRWFDIGVVQGPGLRDLLLPALTLAGFSLAFIIRLTRASMIEVLRCDYVRTAVAKGLPRRRVVWLHALRNAMLPILTYLGPLAAALLTGSFVVEHIFQLPGLGAFFVQSLEDDPPAILGVALFYSALLIAFNLVVDILYGFADPRISVGARPER
jgi:oligopeptide transport system permease protein